MKDEHTASLKLLSSVLQPPADQTIPYTAAEVVVDLHLTGILGMILISQMNILAYYNLEMNLS
jgi:hypothetical protein